MDGHITDNPLITVYTNNSNKPRNLDNQQRQNWQLQWERTFVQESAEYNAQEKGDRGQSQAPENRYYEKMKTPSHRADTGWVDPAEYRTVVRNLVQHVALSPKRNASLAFEAKNSTNTTGQLSAAAVFNSNSLRNPIGAQQPQVFRGAKSPLNAQLLNTVSLGEIELTLVTSGQRLVAIIRDHRLSVESLKSMALKLHRMFLDLHLVVDEIVINGQNAWSNNTQE